MHSTLPPSLPICSTSTPPLISLHAVLPCHPSLTPPALSQPAIHPPPALGPAGAPSGGTGTPQCQWHPVPHQPHGAPCSGQPGMCTCREESDPWKTMEMNTEAKEQPWCMVGGVEVIARCPVLHGVLHVHEAASACLHGRDGGMMHWGYLYEAQGHNECGFEVGMHVGDTLTTLSCCYAMHAMHVVPLSCTYAQATELSLLGMHAHITQLSVSQYSHAPTCCLTSKVANNQGSRMIVPCRQHAYAPACSHGVLLGVMENLLQHFDGGCVLSLAQAESDVMPEKCGLVLKGCVNPKQSDSWVTIRLSV